MQQIQSSGRLAKDLSIIVVNWNSVTFLQKCLSSIQSSTAGISYEIIVIDNASFDGSKEIVEKEFPSVLYVQAPRNEGFAKANNLGFQVSTGRNILFLNPDTEVVGPAVRTMLWTLDSDRSAGAAGAKLLNSDGSVQTSCIQAFPTILNQMLDFDFLRGIFPRASMWGCAALSTALQGPFEVEVISGACLMVKRQVLEAVGLFDTRYFMYSEDVDLCFRIRRGGWKNYFVDTAIVTHHGGQSSSKASESEFTAVMLRESRYMYMSLWLGRLYAMGYRISTILVALARMAAVALFVTVTLGLADTVFVERVMSKWYRVLRWALGMESWVREVSLTKCRCDKYTDPRPLRN
jgi:hypothetical protein